MTMVQALIVLASFFVGLIASLGLLTLGYRRSRFSQRDALSRVRSAPPVDVNGPRTGEWRRVEGRITAGEREIRSAISGLPCVGFRVGELAAVAARANDVDCADFTIATDVGVVHVRADGAPGLHFALAGPRRAAERRLEIGDQVCVVGVLRLRDGKERESCRDRANVYELLPHPKTRAIFVAHTALVK